MNALMELWAKGGDVMWLLLLSAIAGVVIIVERMIVYTKVSMGAKKFLVDFKSHLVQGNVDEAIEICEATPGPVPSLMRAGLMKYQQTKGDMNEVEKAIEATAVTELAFLEKNMTMLVTVFTVAPMLGFLGTVTGMISAFDAIAMAGTVEPTIVASGISEALITTAAGLLIGIPVNMFYNYFSQRIASIIVSIEESTRDFLEILKSQGK